MEDLKVKTCEIHSGNPFSEWCSYCNQALCTTCIEYHQKSKVSKLHRTKPIDNYERLPDIAKCINRMCQFHNDTVEFYCDMHEALCCFQCIIDSHKLCEGIVPLVEVNKRHKNYATMKNMQNKLNEMSKTLNGMISSRRENISLLEKQETRNISKIKRIRSDMTNYLNKLEQRAIEEVKEKIKEEKDCLQNIIDELNNQIEKNNRLHNDIEQIRAFADNLQMLVATKCLSNEIDEIDSSLKDIQTDRRLFDIDLVFDETITIQNFKINYQSFGYVTVSEKPNMFANTKQVKESIDIHGSSLDDSKTFDSFEKLNNNGDSITQLLSDTAGPQLIADIKQVEERTDIHRSSANRTEQFDSLEKLKDNENCIRQLASDTAGQSSVIPFEDVKLNKLDVNLEGDAVQVTSCKLLPNGEVLVLDWARKRLVQIDKDCTLRKEIRFASSPYDFSYIEGGLVAVTLRSVCTISVVNINSAKEVKRHRTKDYCYGIVYNANRLYISLPHLCLVQVLDYKTGNKLEMVKTTYPAFNITIINDNLYCTNHKDSTVYCCSLNGHFKWELRNPELNEPFCISVDPRGYVYVTCRKQSKLIRITLDGELGSVFNIASTGLVHPRALDFCKDSSYLLICAEACPTYIKFLADIIF